MQSRFIQSRVTAVDVDDRTESGGSQGGGTVTLADGKVVAYDWLVVALGAETKLELADGAKEHAIGFANYDDAMRVRS